MVVPPGFSRETRIRRDRFGQWFDGQEPVTNGAIAAAFDRWIDLAPDGRYCLRNAINWAYVEIEGAPIFVRSVDLTDRVELRLSDGQSEQLDPTTLFIDDEGLLHCQVREGTMKAAFTNQALMQLEPIAGEDADGMFVAIGGAKFRPKEL